MAESTGRRIRVGRADAYLALPSGPPTSGVLVLAGSSGRVDVGRADLLARHGAAALALRWFGGPGQPPGICEVPLEVFAAGLDALAVHSTTLGILGASKGAEAALLVAAHDDRVQAVAALAPTDVVWANVGPGLDGRARPWRSSWTRGGEPLPFVPYAEGWNSAQDPAAYLDWYRTSRDAYASHLAAASIGVGEIAADVVLVAGGDDQVWDSSESALRIQKRRERAGLATVVVTHAGAGHRVRLPGEPAIGGGGRAMARGGTPEADAALGRAAWPALVASFRLRATA